MSETNQRPIIVIKKKGGHGGHHGGAWKVAYADFVTAMMSLFIVLWLLNSTPQVKKAIAGYFNDPRGSSRQMGTDVLGSGASVTIDKTNVQDLKEAITKAIVKQKELDKLADQVMMKMTDEGLRIELIEGKNGTFYESGSNKLSKNGIELLSLIAGQLSTLPNHLLIEGHTDSKPFASDGTYSNWELSSDRANSARRLLQSDGVRQDQVSQVRGYADQSLRVAEDPLDPSNRRVSIVVQFLKAPAGTKGPETLDTSGKSKDPLEPEKPGPPLPPDKHSAGGSPGDAKPAEAKPIDAKPVEAKPTAGRIDLPAKPSAATSASKPNPK